MNSFHFRCEFCHEVLNARPEDWGRTKVCPMCRRPIRIPDTPPPEEIYAPASGAARPSEVDSPAPQARAERPTEGEWPVPEPVGGDRPAEEVAIPAVTGNVHPGRAATRLSHDDPSPHPSPAAGGAGRGSETVRNADSDLSAGGRGVGGRSSGAGSNGDGRRRAALPALQGQPEYLPAMPEMGAEHEGAHPGGLNIVGALRRKWWVAALVAFLGAGVGLAAVWLLSKPIYTATGAIEIVPNVPRLLEKDEALPAYATFVNTQASRITSRDQLRATLDHPSIVSLPYLGQFDDPVAELARNLSARPERGTQFLLVSMSGTDPDAVTRIANAAIETYLERYGRQEQTTETERLRALENERKKTENDLKALYAQQEALAQEYGTVDLSGRETIMLERVKGLQEEMARIEASEISLKVQEQLLSERRPTTTAPAGFSQLKRQYVESDPLVQVLRTSIAQLEQQRLLARHVPIERLVRQIADLEREYEKAREQWTSAAPEVARRKTELDRLRADLAAMRAGGGPADAEIPEVQVVLARLATLQDALTGREAELRQKFETEELDRLRREGAELSEAATNQRLEEVRNRLAQVEATKARIGQLLDKQDSAAVGVGLKSVAITKVQNELRFADELYKRLQQEIQRLSAERSWPVARILKGYEPARPFAPANDKRKKYSIVIVMGAVLLGGAAAVLLDKRTMRVYGPVETETQCQVRVLGTTPRFKDLKAARLAPRYLLDDCHSIWVNLSLAAPTDRVRTLVVTSPTGGDGKTTFAVNLATSMALAGKRVLVIDGDQRKPDVCRYLSVAQGQGLAAVLAGACKLDAAIRHTRVPHLHVLPGAVGKAEQAGGLLSGNGALSVAIHDLHQRYDTVIVDTPPLLARPEAKVWAALADGVILVAKSGRTGARDLLEAKRRLQQTGANILGVVLNDVSLRDSYDYYDQRYADVQVDQTPGEQPEAPSRDAFILADQMDALDGDGQAAV